MQGGSGDAYAFGDRGLGDLLAQQRPNVLLLAVEPGFSQGPLRRPSRFPLAFAAASPSLVRSEIRSRATSANNPNRAIITLVRTVTTASLWTRKQRVVVRESRFPGSTKRVLTTSRAIADQKPLLQQRATQLVEHGRGSNHRQETVRNSPIKRARP